MVKSLDAAGVLTIADHQTFAGYCQSVSAWKASELRMRARSIVAEEARAILSDAVGEDRLPALKALNAAEDLVDKSEVQSRHRLLAMLRAAAECGLSPSSRTRVRAATRDAEDPNGPARYFS